MTCLHGGKIEYKHWRDSARNIRHSHREPRLVWGFLFSVGPLPNPNNCLKSGHMGPMTPPICQSVSGSALHTVPHEQPPQKTFLLRMGPIGSLENFLKKSPLTGPLSSHTIPHEVEWSYRCLAWIGGKIWL